MKLENITPRDFFSIIFRRKWLIISMTLLGVCAAGLFLYVTPKIYRSSTLILVENQQVPERYVAAVVAGSATERLTVIKQQVMSRTVLQRVINEFSLAPKDSQSNEVSEILIEGLRKNIQIEFKGQPGTSRIDAFTVSFAHANPETAMKVTGRLADHFVQENLRTREQQVAGTTEFLSHELDRARVSLEQQEHAITTFKIKNMGMLPGQMDANLQTLNRLERELNTVSETIRHRMDRKTALEKMISAYEGMGLAQTESPLEMMANNNSGRDHSEKRSASGDKVLSIGNSLTTRLRQLEQDLVTLSAEYKDTYPDVVALKKEIAHLRGQTEEARGASRQNETAGGQEMSGEKKLAEPKPAGIKGVADHYLIELRREKDETQIGLASLMDQEKRLRAQIHEYQARVELTPEREQGLAVLQRDYENTKRNYQALLEKQLNAKVSEELERRQQAEKFRIVDPANLPAQPEYPDSTRVMLAGLLIGCMAGFGTAVSFELVRKGFFKPEEVEELLGYPVLASIPDFHVYLRSLNGKYLPRVRSVKNQGKAGIRLSAYPAADSAGSHPETSKELSWKSAKPSDVYRYPRQKNGSSPIAELNLIAKWKPNSLAAEQFRVAASRLVLSNSGRKSTVVVVTSAVKGEGKSTTVSNLGYVLAHDLGKSVLLIDCDFKQPMLDVYNGVPSQPGLADVIYGDATLDACIHRHGETSFMILPAGNRDHRVIDLTKISQLKDYISQLSNRFEFIILDAPPILPLADMNLLASMADMLLMVIRASSTPQELAHQAIKGLQVKTKTGVILTACNFDGGRNSPYLLQYGIATGLETYPK